MVEENNNPIMQAVVKVLIAVGIFTVVAKDGKHEYVFDLGLNLSIVIIYIVLVFAVLKIIELYYQDKKRVNK